MYKSLSINLNEHLPINNFAYTNGTSELKKLYNISNWRKIILSSFIGLLYCPLPYKFSGIYDVGLVPDVNEPLP